MIDAIRPNGIAFMMKLSSAFFAAAEREAAHRWDREVAAELLRLYPAHFSALGAERRTVEAFCRTVRDYAVAYHIAGKRETFKLIVVALAQGAHLFHDPRFASLAQRTLAETDIPADRRVALFCDGMRAWTSASHEEGVSLSGLGARMIERIDRHGATATSREAIEAALDGLVLQSPTIAPPSARAAFLDAVLAQADGYGLREPERRLAYAGGALLHGVHWFDDPLMATLRAAIESASGPRDMRERMCAIYARFGPSAEKPDGS